MTKNLLKKIIDDEDLHHAGFNTACAWLAGKIANTISSSVFHLNLNQYNSIDHLVMGVGLGTLAYRKAGRGIKGVAAGLIAGTLFNAAWEGLEYKLDIWSMKENTIDTITDIGVVYAGNILSFLGEKAKEYVNKKEKNKR